MNYLLIKTHSLQTRAESKTQSSLQEMKCEVMHTQAYNCIITKYCANITNLLQTLYFASIMLNAMSQVMPA